MQNFLFPLALTFLLPLHAAAEPSCEDRTQAVCQYLGSAPKGVIRTNADGTIVVNPLTNTGDWPQEHRRYLQMENVNRNNFENRIKPVFNQLKRILMEKVQSLPRITTYRNSLMERALRLDLKVETRERCTRASRPPTAASFDHRHTVYLCPVLSHMEPSALLTVLAHEIGHSVDLCDDGIAGVNMKEIATAASCTGRANTQLAMFPFKLVHCCSIAAQRDSNNSPVILRAPSTPTCTRDDEGYADYISATLVDEFLYRQQRDGTRFVQFSEDLVQRTMDYGHYRIESVCESNEAWRNFGKAIFQSTRARQLLSCSGMSGNTSCTEAQVSPPRTGE